MASNYSDNGFILALGLNAAKDTDQFSLGQIRLEELQNKKSLERTVTDQSANPNLNFQSLKSELADLARDCPSPDESMFVCLSESSPHAERADKLLEKWQWFLNRYFEVLEAKYWNEPINYSTSNMPSYSVMGLKEGQQLLFIRAYLDMAEEDFQTGAELISLDHQMWLRQLVANKSMISLMINIDRAKKNLALGNSLRQVYSDSFVLPAAWQVAMTNEQIEEIMRRTFLYEWQFGQTVMANMIDDKLVQASPLDRLLNKLLIPLFQPQQTSNIFAEQFENEINKSLAILSESSQSTQRKVTFCEKTYGIYDFVSFAYNPTGKLFSCLGVPKVASYLAKIQQLEALRKQAVVE